MTMNRTQMRLALKNAAMMMVVTVLLAPVMLRAQSKPGKSGYTLIREIPLPNVTGWDYMSIDSEGRRLYVGSNAGAVVFDIDAEKVVGNVPDPPFTKGIGLVHGIAIDRELHKGFLSHEVPPSVIIFDINTLKQMGVTPTDAGTDAVLYDPASKRVFTFNGKKPGIHDATAIDADSGKALGNIQLTGGPESAAVDGEGHLYVNISTKSALSQIDTKTLKVTATWPLAPCRRPSGLAIDAAHHRLFVSCDNKLMAMVDADNGKVINTVPIGEGSDAAGFDPGTGFALSSNGDEGSLSVAHEDSPQKLMLVENVKTQPGARTMAIDLKTHRVFLMSGKFDMSHPAKASAENPHGYPEIVKGTAKLLIVALSDKP